MDVKATWRDRVLLVGWVGICLLAVGFSLVPVWI